MAAAGYHPLSWVAWLLAGLTVALLTRNPFYLVIACAAAAFVFGVLLQRQSGPTEPTAAAARPQAWRPVVRLALFLGLFTVLFNALTSHHGRVVLARLPADWPLLGGPLTLEAFLYGLSTALNFLALLLVFTVFNGAVGPHDVLRLLPAFAYQAGVALTIAVSFIPQTVVAWQELQEAHRLRGYRRRRLRDWQPLLVALLGNGLDRAVQLAESMEARGFGATTASLTPGQTRLWRTAVIIGLLALLMGLLARAFWPAAESPALGVMVVGALLVVVALVRQGRAIRRSRYRRWLWRRRDTAVTATALVVVAGMIAMARVGEDLLFYYPYPPYAWIPPFHPVPGLLAALLLLPALLMPPAAPAPAEG
jgi:energy-coupling factor transport system permease protein